MSPEFCSWVDRETAIFIMLSDLNSAIWCRHKQVTQTWKPFWFWRCWNSCFISLHKWSFSFIIKQTHWRKKKSLLSSTSLWQGQIFKIWKIGTWRMGRKCAFSQNCTAFILLNKVVFLNFFLSWEKWQFGSEWFHVL